MPVPCEYQSFMHWFLSGEKKRLESDLQLPTADMKHDSNVINEMLRLQMQQYIRGMLVWAEIMSMWQRA